MTDTHDACGREAHERPIPTDDLSGEFLLTVLIPAYNEARTIRELLGRVIAAPYDKQVIVIDDGSRDDTAGIAARWLAEQTLEERALLLRHVENRGKGAAIRTGLEHACGSITVIQDADLEYDPQDYSALVRPIWQGDAEVVYGTRADEEGVWRWTAHRCCRRLLNMAVFCLYWRRIADESTCYKAFRTELLKRLDLRCERFEFCPEVTAKLCRLGIPIHEVPVRYRPRTLAEGKKIGLRDAVTAFWTLLRWRFGAVTLLGSRAIIGRAATVAADGRRSTTISLVVSDVFEKLFYVHPATLVPCSLKPVGAVGSSALDDQPAAGCFEPARAPVRKGLYSRVLIAVAIIVGASAAVVHYQLNGLTNSSFATAAAQEKRTLDERREPARSSAGSRSSAAGGTRDDAQANHNSAFAPLISGLDFVHNFGLVRPGETAFHRFAVRNSSPTTWTLKRITHNCACAVVEASADAVAPGSDVWFDLKYRAGRETKDDSRAVTVSFVEASAPELRFVAQARVREYLCLNPQSINLVAISRSASSTATVMIDNYSDADWSDLSLASADDWVRCHATLLTTSAAHTANRTGDPRQRWQCLVSARHVGMRPGDYRSVVSIRARELDCSAELGVALRIGSTVTVAPGHLFFGRVVAGGRVTSKTVHIASSLDALNLDPSSARIAHDCGEQIKLRLTKVHRRLLELKATLTPTAVGPLEGSVLVYFDKIDIAPIAVPLFATVAAPSE